MGKLFKSLLFGLPLVILGACSSDEPIGGGNEKESPVADKTEVRYLKVNLVNATGSSGRAIGDDANKDYANGTEAENKIRTIDFYFYDVDKNYHSHVPLSLTTPVDPTTPPNGYSPTSVSGFYETNVPINLIQGDKMPQYVLCVINAVMPAQYENQNMSEAQNQILSSFYSAETDGNYFSMNNSVYFGRDEVNGKDNQLIMATPFDTSKLLTETELGNLQPDQIKDVLIDIYVERYAAEVTLNLANDAIADYEASDNIKLKFVPKKWGINAYEKAFYALKSFRQTPGDAAAGYEEYSTLNNILFEGWNRPDHFRSFWSRTPGYFYDEYPLVADDILDSGNNYPYKVFYQSWNSANNDTGASQYVIETTLKGERLTGENMPDQYLPLTSIPSVVLVGTYQIDGAAKTFYTYQKDNSDKPVIYSETPGAIAGVSKTIKERLLETQSVVIQPSTTTPGSYENVRTDPSNAFVIEHPRQEARTGLKVGGDIVTLQINTTNSGYYYYDSETRSYVANNTANDVAKVNRLLYQNLGGAHAYINGMAFFSAPIQHWGWYREGNPNYDKSMAEWDWSQMKTGDFGIVRNHVYTIDIASIKGLGTGIINTTDPLLPTSDKVSYAVKFRVNIQKWATLPAQKWEW